MAEKIPDANEKEKIKKLINRKLASFVMKDPALKSRHASYLEIIREKSPNNFEAKYLLAQPIGSIWALSNQRPDRKFKTATKRKNLPK